MPTTIPKDSGANKAFAAVFLAFCIALNAGIGALIQYLKLPLYLDLIGSILACAFLGYGYGITTALVGILLLGLLTTPIAWAYVGTALIVTCLARFFVKFGYLQSLVNTIVFGLILGVVSAVVSAPVTTFYFGGVSFVGADAFTAFFHALGNTLATSVVLGGLATDPVDKVLTSVACFFIIRSLPKRLAIHLNAPAIASTDKDSSRSTLEN